MATVDEMFKHLEEEFPSLDTYERKWVSWLQAYHREKGNMSARQKMVLHDIYFRNSDEIEEAMAENNQEMSRIYQQVMEPDSNLSPQEREELANLVGIVSCAAGETHENDSTSALKMVLSNRIPSNTLAELLIEKGIIKEEELLAKLR